MNIYTRRERKLALAWDKTRGFVNHQFEFTSDVLHDIKACGKKAAISAQKFASRDKTSRKPFGSRANTYCRTSTSLCATASRLRSARTGQPNSRKYTSSKVTYLKLNDFYIYSLEWTEKELIWRINNIEVFRTTEGVPTEPLFPMLSAFIAQNQKGGEGCMQVDWIEAWCANK